MPSYSHLPAVLSDYWTLTKPEVNFLILITTYAGFYLGCDRAGNPLSFFALFNTLLGTLLVASGTATLNQYIERKFDAQMRRTARRPAAAGRLEPPAVLAFGIVLSAAGCIYLALAVNLLASLLALLTLLSYLFLYTPLKRRTALCVLVGAFPGAMPPLIGWAAASGRLNMEAWLLYAILFLWQFPHFMAIAWMYREDYDRAGYQMLPKGRARVSISDSPNHVATAGSSPNQHRATSAAPRNDLLFGGASAGFGVLLLWLAIRASAVERSGSPAARNLDCLSCRSCLQSKSYGDRGNLHSSGA